jgi:adenine-specific DNA methylase
MPDQTIKCPNCGKEIPLTETLFHQVKESLRGEKRVVLNVRKIPLKTSTPERKTSQNRLAY